MKILGIIAEYNPFHLGHRYHIQQAKNQIDAQAVIVIMSGHFTQRGEPAIFDKWSRAEMALNNGADLVFELPFAFASRSANYFALGAILSLAKTNLVTHVAFGCEEENLAHLQTISQLLADEPPAYQQQLKHFLQLGHSFAKAQQMAITSFIPDLSMNLNQPNTLLALNYLQIIQMNQLALTPIAIARQGHYHSQALNEGFASATAIRQLILNEHWAALQGHIPANCLPIIQNEIFKKHGPISLENYAPAIFTLLRRTSAAELSNIHDISEGLENRFIQAAKQYSTLQSLCLRIKSKRYPYTRIQRALIHILMNYHKGLEFTQPEYLRVLGFNSVGQQLLKQLQKTSDLPLITKITQSYHQLSSKGQQMLDLDIRATDLYSINYSPMDAKSGHDYYQNPLRILP